MKRLICLVGLIAVAGCSASPMLSNNFETAKNTMGASGGTFSASYAGRFSISACSSGSGTFTFEGAGSGNFIGSSSETGSMTDKSRTGSCRLLWKGPAKLTSAMHPLDTIRLSLAERNFTPCTIRPAFTVTGGTGKFAHATGSGKVVFTCDAMRHTYSDQWAGTISF